MHMLAGSLTRGRWHAVKLVALGCLLSLNFGCATWQPVSIADGPRRTGKLIEPAELKGRQVRFHSLEGVVEVVVTDVEPPLVRGNRPTNSYRRGTEEIDLREVSMIEVRDTEGWKAIAVVATVSAMVVLVVKKWNQAWEN